MLTRNISVSASEEEDDDPEDPTERGPSSPGPGSTDRLQPSSGGAIYANGSLNTTHGSFFSDFVNGNGGGGGGMPGGESSVSGGVLMRQRGDMRAWTTESWPDAEEEQRTSKDWGLKRRSVSFRLVSPRAVSCS